MSMSLTANQSIKHTVVGEDNRLSKEVMVFCPSCKAFETVWFTKGILNNTRKFTQYGHHIYHDCGSNEPCRLYLTL
jgi:hypothetical protein